MNGYIYDISSRKIVTKVKNITKCNSDTIKGDGIAILGTGQYIITEKEFNVGDAIPENIEDKRDAIPELDI